MTVVTEYDHAYVRCTFYHNRQVRPAFEWVRSRYITPRHRKPTRGFLRKTP